MQIMKGTEIVFRVGERAIPSPGIEDEREKQPSQMKIGDFRALQRKDKTKDKEKNPQQMSHEDDVSK